MTEVTDLRGRLVAASPTATSCQPESRSNSPKLPNTLRTLPEMRSWEGRVPASRKAPAAARSEQRPYLSFFAGSRRFIETVEASEALKARARAIGSEFPQFVTELLCESVRREPTDPDAHLAAGLLLATWTVAFTQAHMIFRQKGDAAEARAVFLVTIDKGSIGIRAALAGTPYV